MEEDGDYGGEFNAWKLASLFCYFWSLCKSDPLAFMSNPLTLA